MDTIKFVLILLHLYEILIVGYKFNSPSIYLQTSAFADSIIETNRNCYCVPYWQCKEDFVGLVKDGDDLMDIRVLDDNLTDINQGECSGEFDICCQVQCGKLGKLKHSLANNSAMAYRIMTDQMQNAAYFGEFPWMLGLLQNRVYKCGASLIHPKVAITAAHCVSNGGVFKVRAGEFDWENLEEPMPHQDRYTETIIIHPGYHPSSLRNDIAILILDNEFKLTENVGIICLPSQIRSPLQLNINQHCLATGWGKNSFRNGAYQTKLKKVELPIVNHNECLHRLRVARLGPHFQLHSSFLCAGGQHNRDTCKGDGGSPLICAIDEFSEHFQQIGIVSWGLTCGLRNTPGVYVNVAMFVDWIDKQLEDINLDTMIYKLLD